MFCFLCGIWIQSVSSVFYVAFGYSLYVLFSMWHLDTVCMFCFLCGIWIQSVCSVFYVAFGYSMFVLFSQVPNSNILTSPVAELQLRVGSE